MNELIFVPFSLFYQFFQSNDAFKKRLSKNAYEENVDFYVKKTPKR